MLMVVVVVERCGVESEAPVKVHRNHHLLTAVSLKRPRSFIWLSSSGTGVAALAQALRLFNTVGGLQAELKLAHRP